eukprot:3379999-Prymnesium_polylepis.2
MPHRAAPTQQGAAPRRAAVRGPHGDDRRPTCALGRAWQVGGKFMMFSGSVEGENVKLTPYSSEEDKAVIEWKWRFNTWQPGQFSKVTITLTGKDGQTKLELVQTGVPEDEKERTEKGWNGLLFDRLKAMLGGSVIR